MKLLYFHRPLYAMIAYVVQSLSTSTILYHVADTIDRVIALTLTFFDYLTPAPIFAGDFQAARTTRDVQYLKRGVHRLAQSRLCCLDGRSNQMLSLKPCCPADRADRLDC